jgi:tetratricopeptide (TPR) repeat protein
MAAEVLGISLAGLRAFVAASGGRAALEGRSTAWVRTHLVLPATLASGGSYASLLVAAGSPHVAPATEYVVHAHGDAFLGLLDALATLEAAQHFFLDLFSDSQHAPSPASPLALKSALVHAIGAAGRALLVVHWAAPTPLQRAWCLLELAIARALGAPLLVLLPPADFVAFDKALRSDTHALAYKLCRADAARARARDGAALAAIQRAMTAAPLGGFQKTNQLVNESLRAWVVEEGRGALAEAEAAGDGVARAELLASLGSLLREAGQLGEAEPLLRQALSASAAALGADHADTLAAASALASLLGDLGRLAEAAPLLRGALAGRRRALGSEHASTLRTMVSLAAVLREQGDAAGAAALYSEALDAARRALGVEHPDTLACMLSYAGLLLEQGRRGEALALYQEELAAVRSALGEGHPSAQQSLRNYERLAAAAGEPQRARCCSSCAVC